MILGLPGYDPPKGKPGAIGDEGVKGIAWSSCSRIPFNYSFLTDAGYPGPPGEKVISQRHIFGQLKKRNTF